MANENGEPNGAGRLRWWQDESSATRPAGSRWYSAPPLTPKDVTATSLNGPQAQAHAFLPEELDIGDELEAEALRRAALERDSVAFEGVAAETAQKKWRQMLWILTPILLMQLGLALATQQWYFLVPIAIYLAEVFFLVQWLKRRLQRSPPKVTISRYGLSFQMPYYQLGPVPWNEIKSVRARKMLFFRFLQIDFWDQKATFRKSFRASGKLTWLNWFNEKLLCLSALQLDEAFFPVPAETIAARAAQFSPVNLDPK